MKKGVIIALVVVGLFIAAYFAIFQLTMPKVAKAFVPTRWQNIPLGQKKSIVHQYLGEPDSVDAEKDHWRVNINPMKRYVLDIEYDADTVSFYYHISYEAEVFSFLQRVEVKSDSLK